MKLYEILRQSVNNRCSCGGGGPSEGCPACQVYHDVQDTLKKRETCLIDAALDAAAFLFQTFQFRQGNKVTERAWEVHDKLIEVLDMQDDPFSGVSI